MKPNLPNLPPGMFSDHYILAPDGKTPIPVELAVTSEDEINGWLRQALDLAAAVAAAPFTARQMLDMARLFTWGRAFEDAGHRIVAQDRVGVFYTGYVYFVSTVFLGLDHGFRIDPDHEPVLWETMVFHERRQAAERALLRRNIYPDLPSQRARRRVPRDPLGLHDNEQRYSSFEAAIAGHLYCVEEVRTAIDQARGVARARVERVTWSAAAREAFQS